MTSQSILLFHSSEPQAAIMRPYEPKPAAKPTDDAKPLTRFHMVRVTVEDGVSVASMEDAEDKLLAMVPMIQIPPPQPLPPPADKQHGMTREQQKTWRVVTYANKATVQIANVTKRPGPYSIIMHPKLAELFGNTSMDEPRAVGRWVRLGTLGMMAVWISDCIPEDEFIIATEVPQVAERGVSGAGVVLTGEDGSLHMVTDFTLKGETPLCKATDYIVRYRF